MPETTANYYEVPNPNWPASAFADQYRTTDLSAAKGIKARWCPLKSTGNWKIKTLMFAKANWPNAEACDTWVREHKQELKGMDPAQTRIKSVQLAETKAAAFGPRPADDDLALINEYALEPLSAEQVYVRRMRLCNDQRDRDMERFSRGVLNQFAETLPGKSVLIGHEKRSAPIGRFYKAEVKREAGVTHLMGYWYAPVTAENEHDRASIDSGVWSMVSIGFIFDEAQCDLCGKDVRSQECRHIPGAEYPLDEADGRDLSDLMVSEDGKTVTCTVTFRGKAEAIEGSIVYLGAQYNAEMVKAKAAGDMAEYKRLLLRDAEAPPGDGPAAIDDTAAPADAGAVSVPATGEPGGDGSKSTPGAAGQVDPSGGTDPTESEAHHDMDTDEKAALEAELAAAKAGIEAADERAATAEAKLAELRKEVAAMRAPYVAEVQRLAGLLGHEKVLETLAVVAGDDLSALPTEKLVDLCATWQKQFDDAKVPGRQSTPADPPAQTPESPARPARPVSLPS